MRHPHESSLDQGYDGIEKSEVKFVCLAVFHQRRSLCEYRQPGLRGSTNVSKGDDALAAYKVGHSVAMDLARDAGAKTSDSEKANGLQDAYMHEGMKTGWFCAGLAQH